MFDKEYVFRGKHAEMVKRLTGKLDDSVNRALFKTNYDVYAVAPVLGLLYNEKAELDKGTADSDITKIFRDKLMDEKDQLVFNYRLIMMSAFKGEKSLEERVEIAFKLDDNDEARKPYDELYDSYVRGGVEILYNKIFSDGDTTDDKIKNMYEFLEEVYNRYYNENYGIVMG